MRRLLAGRGPKLLTDLAVLMTGQFGAMLVATAAFAVLARELDPGTYGAVEYVVGLTALFGIAVEGGLATVGVRRVAESRSDLSVLATLIPIARVLVALVAIPVLIVTVELVGPEGATTTLVLLYAASLLLWAWNQDWLLQSVELMPLVAVARMLRMLVFLAGVVLLVHGPGDVSAVGWAELAGLGAALIYYLGIQHFKVAAVRMAVSMRDIVTLMREGAAIALTTFAWSAAQYMPLFLVGSLVGGSAVGLYAASQRVVIALSILSFVYYFNLYPTLARSLAIEGEFARLLHVSFRVVAWGSIGLALGLSLAASPLLSTVFGAQFTDAAPALALLVWTIPATFLSGEARWALITLRAQSRVLYAQLAGLAAIVVAGVPLVLLFDELGAGAAAVSGALVVWVAAHASARSLDAPLAPRTLVLKPLLLALACASAVQLIDAAMLVKALAAVALYAAAAPFADRSLVPDLSNLANARAKSEPVGTPVESAG